MMMGFAIQSVDAQLPIQPAAVALAILSVVMILVIQVRTMALLM
jgi:hypothetical protein